jgi:S1-C subfamily serine protease
MYPPSRSLGGLSAAGIFLAATAWFPGPLPAAAAPGADTADASAAAVPLAALVKPDTVENSVVKVFSTMRFPDPYRPWGKQEPREATGSGVVIEGHRILTNAHVVLYATQVQVQASQAGDKIPARVEAIAPGIDLAVLRLEDESFFDTHPPLARASALPAIKDPAVVYGFPTGGTSLSITKGIVSRIEFVPYNFPVAGLRIQIDAAINPGNSGGPAVAGDRMIGLAFSRLTGNAENIGYIIPSEEIALFLRDIAGRTGGGKPFVDDGKPGMHDELQTLENPGLRAFLRVGKSVEGLVVNRPDSADPAYPLKPWDVITRIGDTPINDQGMIQLRDNLQVNFGYLVQNLAVDGTVPLSVVRGGRLLAIRLPVAATRPMLIPDLRGAYPPYFVCGPLVFSVATAQFLDGFGANANAGGVLRYLSSIGSPLMARRGDRPAFPGEQLVVISSPFFPHRLAENYSSQVLHVVKTVNGIRIRNLRHLVEVLRDCREPFVVVEFHERDSESLVFPREAMFASTDDILTDNGVRAQGSPDMLAVWNAKAATP